MKNLVVGMFAVLGLAACSDSEGDGSGGAGGIQEAEATSSTGEPGTGGGDGCAISADGTALCAAIDACDPGKADECAVELAEERCADTACLSVYDEWVTCWRDLADADQIPECADYPAACGAQRDSYESCIAGDACEATPSGQAVCDAAVACDAGNTLPEECLSDLGEERCADAACTGLYDGWLSCIEVLVDNDEWTVCPDFPFQCDFERSLYEECIDPSECSAGPDAATICDAFAACEDTTYEECIADLTSERCAYSAGSECRALFDSYNSCVEEVAAAGEWDDCPDVPAACDDVYGDYASNCI